MEDIGKWECPFDEQLIKAICPEYEEEKLRSFLEIPKFNYSLGSMFGSFIGDALGAYLEFSKIITSELVSQAMEMSPGGFFNIRAGQVTDDSELSFHMLAALSKYEPMVLLSDQRTDLLMKIVEEYVEWKKSRPFDIGITCRNGLKVLEESKQMNYSKQKQKENGLNLMYEKVLEVNNKSESNGSMMRITPLVFFSTLLSLNQSHTTPFTEIEQFAKDEIRMLHPSPQIIKSSLHWFKTLVMLTKRSSNNQIIEIYKMSIKEANHKMEEWGKEVQAELPMDANKNKGWAKIAWSYGIRELKQLAMMLQGTVPKHQLDQFYFMRVIQSILERGGDTDTNAAIVGGLLGAVIGFKNLPKIYLKKMFEVDFSKKELKRSHQRPRFYQPRRVFVRAYEALQRLRNSAGQVAPKQ